MEYKLLRALSIVLQAGLVILLLMLLGLAILACKPIEKTNTAKNNIYKGVQRDIIQQRLHNDILQNQLYLKTLCFEKQTKGKTNLLNTQLAKASFSYTQNSLANQRF